MHPSVVFKTGQTRPNHLPPTFIEMSGHGLKILYPPPSEADVQEESLLTEYVSLSTKILAH